MSDGRNVVKTDENGVVIYEINKDEIIKTVEVGSPIFSKSATDGENIFVSDFSGRVICLKIKEGE